MAPMSGLFNAVEFQALVEIAPLIINGLDHLPSSTLWCVDSNVAEYLFPSDFQSFFPSFRGRLHLLQIFPWSEQDLCVKV